MSKTGGGFPGRGRAGKSALTLAKYVLSCCPAPMADFFGEEIELRPVDLEAVHLLVLERVAAQDVSRVKERLAVFAQLCIGRERAAFRDPRADRPLGNMHLAALADDGLGFR